MSTVPHTSSTDKPELEQNHAPVRIDPDKHAVPAAIAHLPRFAVWRYDAVENRDGTTKRTKVPYRPNGVGTASKTNAADWGTLEQALATVRRDPSTGLAFCLNSTALVGVDFDRVLDANGNPSVEFQGLLKHLHGVGCYAEVSPSGTGVKILLRANAGAVAKAVAALTGKTNKETTKFTAARPGLKEVQVFYGGGYFTLTGAPWGREEWNGQRWDDATQALEALVRAAHALKFREGGKANKTHEAPIRLAVALSDDEVLDKAFAAKNGSQVRAIYDGSDEFHGGDASAADCALARHFAWWCGPNGHDQVARLLRASPRNRDKFDREDYMAATIAKAYEGLTEFYDPARKRNEPRPQQHRNSATASTRGILSSENGEPVALAKVDEFALGDEFRKRFHGAVVWSDQDRWFRRDEASGILHEDTCGTIFGEAIEVVRYVLDAGEFSTDTRRKFSKVAVANATLRAARSYSVQDDGLAVHHGALDANPWLLGTPAGVLNLKTGELRPGTIADLVTKATKVAPADKADENTCPEWLRFMDFATGGNARVAQYLQRFAGYCLSGDLSEHAILWLYGPGGTGKSTFMEVLSYVLGDYAVPMSPKVLMGSEEQHGTHTASLHGARLALCSEFPEGQRLNEARLKRLSGGDRMRANFMRQDEFTFENTAKLMAGTNFKPRLVDVSDAMARRLNIVEFMHKLDAGGFRERVHGDLKNHMKEREAPGILRWMLDGLQALQQNREAGIGLNPPREVQAATKDYLAAQDSRAAWWDDHFIYRPDDAKSRKNFMPTAIMLASWNEWAEANGIEMKFDAIGLGEFMHTKFGAANHRVRHDGTLARGYFGVLKVMPKSEYDTSDQRGDGCSD